MNRTMTADEVYLSMRILGLRRTRWGNATRNRLRLSRRKDGLIAEQLIVKGHAEICDIGHRLTGRGIDQLRLQIGEFRFILPTPARHSIVN